MTMNSLEQLTGRFSKLPINTQEAIKVFNYDYRFQKIHKKYKLHIDQSVTLESLVADIIFGDLKSLELTDKIEKELRIDRGIAVEIALEINKELILPLREEIKKVQGE